MRKRVLVFGYSNLLIKRNYSDLDCDILNIFPVQLVSFVRVFNFFNGEYTVMNIDKSDLNDMVWGLAFEIYLDDLEKFSNLECGTELVKVDVLDKKGNHFKAFLFRAEHFEAEPFRLELKSQEKYLGDVLDSVSEFGEDFVLDFKKTSFIGKKSLLDLGY